MSTYNTPAEQAEASDDFDTALAELPDGTTRVTIIMPTWLLDVVDAEARKFSDMVGYKIKISRSFMMSELMSIALVPQAAALQAADMPVASCALGIFELAAKAQEGPNELSDIEDLFKAQDGRWQDVALFLKCRQRAYELALDRAAATNGAEVVSEAQAITERST